MSSAFKVFLLMLLLFGALSAYRFRAREFRAWLDLARPEPAELDELPGLRSAVERVIDPREPIELAIPAREERSPPGRVDAQVRAVLRYEALPSPVFEEPLLEAPEDAGSFADPPPLVPVPAEAAMARREEPTLEEEKEPVLVHLKPKPPRRKAVSHVVQKSETLAALARKYYGNDTERWPAIFAANRARIEDPDRLSPGLVLEIPDAVTNLPAEVARRPAEESRGTGKAPATKPRAGRSERAPSGAPVGGRARGANGG